MKKIVSKIIWILVVAIILFVGYWAAVFIYEIAKPIPTQGELLHQYDLVSEFNSWNYINIVKTEQRGRADVVQVILNSSTGAGEYEKPILICSNFLDIELSDISGTSAKISSLVENTKKAVRYEDYENMCNIEIGDVLEYSFENFEEDFPIFFL